MVVCPCGVMVPAAGVGRARRGPRGPTGCFDSPVTVTTQPKEPQETPASVEKLAAAAAAATTVEPSSIPRPLSRTSKNKGTNNKGPEELKGDLASRTTLALATTESGRYVGTRPLRSNRSPTPTLHRLPQKTISRDSSANGGRSKHLPAIRTSPTAPLDNHNGGGGGGGSRGSTRVKGPASVLPRNNTVNQRMQDLNSNQRRLQKQNQSPDEVEDPMIKSGNPTITKTFNHTEFYDITDNPVVLYENINPLRTEDTVIYENLRELGYYSVPLPQKESENLNPESRGDVAMECDDVTGKHMKDASDSTTPEASTVWLSESWKYNTIKKAPEFNIFEFPDIDAGREHTSKSDEQKTKKEIETDGKHEEKIKILMTKGKKKKLRSRLPLFGWKSEKESHGDQSEKDIKTFQKTSEQVCRPDNKWVQKFPAILKNPVRIHKTNIEKADKICPENEKRRDKKAESIPTYNVLQITSKPHSSLDTESFCKSRQGEKAEKNLSSRDFRPTNKPHQERYWLDSPSSPFLPQVLVTNKAKERDSHGNSNVSSEVVLSCVSPLISPGTLSLRSPQMGAPSPQMGALPPVPASRASPHPSPTPSERQVPQHPHKFHEITSFPEGETYAMQSRSSSLEDCEEMSHAYGFIGSSRSYQKPEKNQKPKQGVREKEALIREHDKRKQAKGETESQKQYETEKLMQGHMETDKPNIAQRQYTKQIQRQKETDKTIQGQRKKEMINQGQKENEISIQGQGKTKRNSTLASNSNKETSTAIHFSRLKHEESTSRESSNTRKRILKECNKEEDSQTKYFPLEGNTKTSASSGKSLENKKRWKQDPQRSKEILKERSLSSNTCIPHSSSREAFRNDPPVKEEGRALPAGGYWNEWLVSRNHEPEKKLSRRNWSKRSSSRCYENVSRLPSPSPSCPPSAEEERFTIPSQYHSLPQLHSCINKDSKCNRSIDYKSHASFIPYFTRDFGSITKMPKSQKYSHTSLIDQALESLEMSSSTVTGSHTVKSESFQVSPFDHWHEGLNLPLLSTGQIESSSTSTSSSSLLTPARSPILPPLPAGVLDNCPKIPEQNIASSDASPNTDNNLESVCILSLDVTVDCKEFTRDRFKVTNINNSSESEQEMDEENLRNASLPTPILSKTLNNENGRKEDDTKSGRNSVLSIEEKYYENDDYETTEDTECNILRDEEQSQLDASIALLTTPLSTASTSTDSEKANSATGNNDDEDDFIDIDCDVKPMEALKRPLVYGYGSRPIHSLQGSSFLERRLSSASDASEYMEMDIAETLSTGKVEDVQYQKSESCMNLRETYWDYWQAKQASSKMSSNRSSLCGDYSSIESPVATTCPSQRFCYDPEVLLAHVRCPKSLEDATFKQYSAYVKSHIYDYFGDVKETLKDYGLENNHYNWISSQPELLPQTSNHQPFSKTTALDYSSEPELSYNDESIYLRGKASYKYPTLTPPSRRPPPLCKKNRSQDSGTWTYLQSSQESAPGFNAKDVYPVPLPRSTSSLSHIGPNLYNPWTHLLPDVTPPRTPRHSINYTTTVLPEAKTVSPSSCRKSLPKSPKESTAYIVNSKLTQKSGRSYVNKQSNSSSPKRSLLPNLSKVVKSPLKMQVFRSRAPEIEDSLDIVPDLPRVHPSIQTRTHTTTSSKSSSSSSSSSSASSKDSVTTVIPATARTKGSNWLLRHFGGAKSKMTAV